MDPSVSEHSPSPSPEDELAFLFETHCEVTGAVPAEVGEHETLKNELLTLIERLIGDEDEDEGGAICLGEPEFTVVPVGFATEEDGRALLCVEILNDEGCSVLFCADEEEPIILPPGNRGVMVYDFSPLEDAPEDGQTEERYSVCLGNILTAQTHRAECARVLNHDLDGFYGRKLRELLDTYHHTSPEPESIGPAELAAPVDNVQVIRYLDADGWISFAELGPINGTTLNYVRTVRRFPPQGADFDGASRHTAQSEALVSDFTSFYSTDDSVGLIVEDEPVADDYLSDLQEYIRGAFFLTWNDDWRVVASNAVFPAGAKDFCVFARVVDGENRSVLPTIDGTASGEPLYSGFAITISEATGETATRREYYTHGFVLSQSFLHRDFETM